MRDWRRQEDWRLPGCGDDCRLVPSIRPGLLGRDHIETHDPLAHETWGRSHCGMPHGTPAVVETGPLRVDLGRVEVTVDGHPIHTTPNEMRLLLAFARMAGQLASIRSLIEETWGPAYLLEDWRDNAHLLRVNIARVRARLGRAGGLITTVLGLGYRLELIAPGAQVPYRRPLTTGGRSTMSSWSQRFTHCICCGRTWFAHKGHGRCTQCYSSWPGGRIHIGPCAAPPPSQEDS